MTPVQPLFMWSYFSFQLSKLLFAYLLPPPRSEPADKACQLNCLDPTPNRCSIAISRRGPVVSKTRMLSPGELMCLAWVCLWHSEFFPIYIALEMLTSHSIFTITSPISESIVCFLVLLAVPATPPHPPRVLLGKTEASTLHQSFSLSPIQNRTLLGQKYIVIYKSPFPLI